MKRALSGVLFLLLSAASAVGASQTKLLDDVIRMSRAGVSDDAIVAFIHATRDRVSATADDVIAMSEAGVLKAVIEAMIADPQPNAEQAGSEPEPPSSDSPGDDKTPPPDAAPPTSEAPESADGIGCLNFDPPIVVYYEPPWPAWIWDPFWYQPRPDIQEGAVAASGPAAAAPPAVRARGPMARGEGSRPTQEARPHPSGDRGHGVAARRR
jgi:hypothetical protein